MSSVYRVRWRVLRQRLDDTLAHARQRQDHECVRLAALGIALLERHAVDAKGWCQSCRARRWWRRRQRRCQVLPMMSLYLEQPMELLMTGERHVASN